MGDLPMYEKYWELREKPFENTPNPIYFYRSPSHEEAFSRLIYAIRERKGAALVSGDYGCGKTLLGRALLTELDTDHFEVAILSNPKLSPSQFLKELVHQLGSSTGSNDKVKLMHELNEILYGNFHRGKETVILVDEAQAIPSQGVFEEIRLLLNFQLNERFLLTLLLLGQPELREKVESIPQLSQRIAIRYHLRGMTLNDTEAYIQYRLRVAGASYNMFDQKCFPLIHEFTEGVPRKINNLCDLCLFGGFGIRAKQINETLVSHVISDLKGEVLPADEPEIPKELPDEEIKEEVEQEESYG